MLCKDCGSEMEWVDQPDMPYEFPNGGYWHCEQCRLDEEADFDPEHSDFEDDADLENDWALDGNKMWEPDYDED